MHDRASRFSGDARKAIRQQPHLDRSRGVELALEARFRLALMLQLGHEPAPLRFCRAKTRAKHHPESCDGRQARIDRVDQQVSGEKTSEGGAEEDQQQNRE